MYTFLKSWLAFVCSGKNNQIIIVFKVEKYDKNKSDTRNITVYYFSSLTDCVVHQKCSCVLFLFTLYLISLYIFLPF